MACWYLFKQQAPLYIETLYNRKRDAEQSRLKEYTSAVQIQSWYRGIRLRCYIKHLNEYATIIQRHWRGYVGRKKYRLKLIYAYDAMCVKKFNTSAMVIQKHWKGYFVRKYSFDYYKYKKYLLDLEVTNNYTLQFINEFQRNQMKEMQMNRVTKKAKEMESWASRNHYLISTKVQPGIYNSPYNKNQSDKEYLLKESQKFPNKLKSSKNISDNKLNDGFIYDPSCILVTEKPLPSKHLAPLLLFPPQGPFKKPEEVRKQRYRSLNPSLRVMTDFESLEKARNVMKNEEWTKRLHDDVFLPVINKPPPYEQMLLTSTVYSNQSNDDVLFGKKKYQINDKTPFKTIVPPIQTFEKLNKQYIENYSI